jgi:hypothetical protein
MLSALKSREAQATVTVMGGAGVSAGSLSKSEGPLLSKGYNYSLQLSYVPGSARKPWPMLLGAQLRQLKLSFTEDGVQKRATYNLYGAHLGFALMLSPNLGLQVLGEYYGTGQISVLATHQVRLNGSNYKFSSFEEYTGSAAAGARLQITHDKADGQFSASNRYRSGVGLSLVQQNFGRESTRITSSDSERTPDETFTQSEVSYRLMIISVDLFIGLSF